MASGMVVCPEAPLMASLALLSRERATVRSELLPNSLNVLIAADERELLLFVSKNTVKDGAGQCGIW